MPDGNAPVATHARLSEDGGVPRAGPTRGGRRLLALGIALGVAVASVAAAIVLPPLLLLHRQDLPFERAYGNAMVSLVAGAGSGGASPPAQDRRQVEAGRNAYVGSCGQCHGERGDGKGVFGQTTYPPATDLTGPDSVNKSDAELFWITKNGLSFTGMPSFAGQYSDRDIWALVAYVRALQQRQARPVAVPTPSTQQVALADPTGDVAQRGAAVYFAQGCHTCHGPVGDAPGDLGLRGGSREATEAVRQGRRGMPAYGPQQIDDAQLRNLLAYMDTFPSQPRRKGGESRG